MTLSELREDAVRVSVRGRLDTVGVDAIEARFAVAVEARHALVDLSGVSFLASTGIRMFLRCARTLKAAGRQLVLVAPQGLVNAVLDNAGVSQVVPVVPDEAHALELLPSPGLRAFTPPTGHACGIP